eukprot:CAMPEP_0177667690 /NCGR_PEP_ID=MMETSP0447-20121125/22266_1 /TAXON_ID=0 /ORGANISM="Stygamoeba regulata, Strain BSH-02190019" /LENGTH=179 /DNA_ID=CAMNT_0019173955 /DNA_START=262 /DNA_END=798 /DNA_ORIENTATION=-
MSSNEISPPSFETIDYWNDEYTRRKRNREWYFKFEEGLDDLLEGHLKTASTVLSLGCGNSVFSQSLAALGHTVIGVDNSPTVIEQMSAAHADNPRMEFRCIDCCAAFPFQDETFDLVFDKGTFDCIRCGPGWAEKIRICLEECHRALKPGGVLLSISHSRWEVPFNKDNWDINTKLFYP